MNGDGLKQRTQNRNKVEDHHVFSIGYKVCYLACEAVQRVAVAVAVDSILDRIVSSILLS